MKADKIYSCYIGPQISPEQFVPEHFFLYLIKGKINGYDGDSHQHLSAGEYCLVRKNHLARYNKTPDAGSFEKVVVIFDETYLKSFLDRHDVFIPGSELDGAFISLPESPLISNFIMSLAPHYTQGGKISEEIAQLKRDELLLILLELNPSLAASLFNFGVPQKIDLKVFMQKHYKFNVSLERFAYMAGRSVSAFKRDFKQLFNETPSRWLIHRRLQEAHFLLENEHQKPSDFYLDLGFENLSHFSFAFKKQYGVAPSQL